MVAGKNLNMRKIKITHKKFYIFLTVFTVLVVGRILLPQILLKKANHYLATFSDAYELHMQDLDISIIRGAYRFEQVNGKLKLNNKHFLKINSVDVSVAWREIFKGRIVTDVVANQLEFLVLTDMSRLTSPKDDAVKSKSTLFPAKVERVDFNEAQLVFEEYPSLTESERLRIRHINGRITNLTPNEKNQISHFNFTASLLSFFGELNIYKEHMSWHLNAQMKGFDLTALNSFLKRHVPLTFTQGQLDLYLESHSTNEKIQGYIKPFFKKVDIMKNEEHFKNVKHFGIEILTAISNLILRDTKKDVATTIEFDYDGKLNVKKAKAIKGALKNGFVEPLAPGIENRYHL